MKYIQLYAIDKDSVTMPQHWRNHLAQKDGYKIVNNGPYNWIKVFGGHMAWAAGLPLIELDNGEFCDIRELKDTVFHIHLTGENFELINSIKSLSPDTQILTSIDYAMNLWDKAIGFFTIDHVVNVASKADFVFSTEDQMARVLSVFLKKDVPCIPHPYNVSETAKHKSEKFDEPRECAIMLHEQDGRDFYQAHLALKDLPIRTHCLNVPMELFNRLNGVVFNKVSPYTSFEFMVRDISWVNEGQTRQGGFLPKAFMSYDSYSHRVTGRWQQDCAALGIPCVGSSNSMMQKMLYPELVCESWSVFEQREKLRKLLNDGTFYRCIHQNCQVRLKSFDMEVSRDRLENWITGEDFHDFKKSLLVDSYVPGNLNIIEEG